MPVNNRELYDRNLVDDDERKRSLNLSGMNLVAPSVGVCDAPHRVYLLNNEWAKIVMGLVSWLATIAPWAGDVDETSTAIQGIETFMLGCEPCGALAECIQALIDTSYGDLSDALRDLYDALKDLDTRQGDGTTQYPVVNNEVLVEILGACDYDHLFAACTGLVDYANLAIVDFLQKVEASTAGLAMARDVISAIPILGLLPFDEIIDMADAFLDGLLVNYQAAYTQEIRDRYRCALFCIAKDECSLYFVQAFGYFADQASMTIAETDLTDVVEFLTQGVFSGEEYSHVMHALFFFILAFGGSFAGDTSDRLAKVVEAKYNDADADWSILCDTCTWEYQRDFTTEGAGNWVLGSIFIAEYQGVIVPGVGWQETPQDNSDTPGEYDWSKALCIEHALSVDSTITYVRVEYDFNNSGNWDGVGNTNLIQLTNVPTNEISEVNAVTHPTGTGYSQVFQGIAEVTGGTSIKLRYVSGRHWQNSNPGGQCTVKAITVRGVGDNPFD